MPRTQDGGQHVWATPAVLRSLREIQAFLKEKRGVDYGRPIVIAEALEAFRKQLGMPDDYRMQEETPMT